MSLSDRIELPYSTKQGEGCSSLEVLSSRCKKHIPGGSGRISHDTRQLKDTTDSKQKN